MCVVLLCLAPRADYNYFTLLFRNHGFMKTILDYLLLITLKCCDLYSEFSSAICEAIFMFSLITNCNMQLLLGMNVAVIVTLYACC